MQTDRYVSQVFSSPPVYSSLTWTEYHEIEQHLCDFQARIELEDCAEIPWVSNDHGDVDDPNDLTGAIKRGTSSHKDLA